MTGRQADPILRTEGITAGYGRRSSIIFDVDASFRAGEVVSIIGPNGAGKSTLLKTLFGLTRIQGGSFFLDGVACAPLARELVGAGITYVPQVLNVFPTLTVRENLEIGTYVRKGPGVERALELFRELEPLMHRKAGKLSGGQVNMLAVARAVTSGPRMLLLDEATGGLAPMLALRLWNYVRSLATDEGIGVVAVEQNVEMALDHSDRVYILASGKARFDGTAVELRNSGWAGVEDLFFEGVSK